MVVICSNVFSTILMKMSIAKFYFVTLAAITIPAVCTQAPPSWNNITHNSSCYQQVEIRHLTPFIEYIEAVCWSQIYVHTGTSPYISLITRNTAIEENTKWVCDLDLDKYTMKILKYIYSLQLPFSQEQGCICVFPLSLTWSLWQLYAKLTECCWFKTKCF